MGEIPIPILGGPTPGRIIEVDENDPPMVLFHREEARIHEPTILGFAAWARLNGHPPTTKSRAARQAHAHYVAATEQAAQVPRAEVVAYRLCRWGRAWSLHYVHPSHPLYDVALAL